MKTTIIILACFFNFSSFSQANDIFILIDKNSNLDTISSKNDSIEVNTFRLKLNSNFLEYEFYKDSIGNMRKKIFSKNKKSKTLELEYKNINNNNPQILISEYLNLNYITYNDILHEKNFEKLVNLIKSYKNIFLIDKNNKCGNYYVVKKVIVKPNKSNL